MNKINLTIPNPGFSMRESYKSLRTNILLCGADIKVIAITSCESNEGKTGTSFSLAESLAEDGKRVAYLDADLRKSVFIKTYRVTGAQSGLSHYLAGLCEFDEIINKTNIPGLYVVNSGAIPPNPAELLGNLRFDNMIAAMRNAFDFIIIDTAPLGLVTDCAVISKSCDGIVMVVSSGDTKITHAQNVIRQIKKTGTALLGVVLNKVDMSSKGYYGGYYYSGYGQEEK